MNAALALLAVAAAPSLWRSSSPVHPPQIAFPHQARVASLTSPSGAGNNADMSFQAYLDAVEDKTGRTPEQIVELAHQRGFVQGCKVGPVIAWLKEDFGLGHGHAQAMAHVICKGVAISDKHVGSTGSHRDDRSVLRLEGKDRA